VTAFAKGKPSAQHPPPHSTTTQDLPHSSCRDLFASRPRKKNWLKCCLTREINPSISPSSHVQRNATQRRKC